MNKKRIYSSKDENVGAGSTVSPYDRANIFQIYSLSYMLPLFKKSRRKQLTLQDIGPAPRADTSRTLGQQLQQAYNVSIMDNKRPSLTGCLMRVFGWQLFAVSLLDLLSKCVSYPMLSIVLGWLIRDTGIYLNFAVPLIKDAANTTATATNATATAINATTPTTTTLALAAANSTNTTAGAGTAPILVGPAAGLTADEAYWRIIYDAILLVLVQAGAIVLAHPFFFQTYRLGMKCRVAACFLIYKKSLRLSQSALSETTVGQMVNLLSNDVNRFDQVAQMLPYLILAPLQAITVLVILSLFYLGAYPTLASLAAILVYVIIQSLMGRAFSKYRSKTARRTDERVRLMNEIILAMKIIKMYAWERPFQVLVGTARRREMTTIGMGYILRAINQTLFFTSSKIIVFVALMVYVALDSSLNPEIVFVTIGLANLVRISLTLFFPNAIAYVAETIVSCRRIDAFLALPEVEFAPANYRISSDALGCQYVLTMSKVYAGWTTTTAAAAATKTTTTTTNIKQTSPDRQSDGATASQWAILRNLTLAIKPRDLVLVVGRVGSGKSSVLMTILGELPVASGRLEINGRISYASQEAWIFSGTVRDNILFGKPFEPDRYKRVIRVCSLRRDLDILVDGDQTIVGERGVSLSGGQKARVNLARALYQDADIYLLDDPLSAVDAPVARHIFNESLRSFLKKKTVILATHQLQFLRHATKVLVVDRNSPAAFGTLQEVMESEAFAVVDYSPEAFKDATTATDETGAEGEPQTEADDEAKAKAAGAGSVPQRRERLSSRSSSKRDGASSGGSTSGSRAASSGGSGGELQSQTSADGRQPSAARSSKPAAIHIESEERYDTVAELRPDSQASSNLAESMHQMSSPPLMAPAELEQRRSTSPTAPEDLLPEQKMALKRRALGAAEAPAPTGSSRRLGIELLSDISTNLDTYRYYLRNATGALMFVWFIVANVLVQTLYQYTDYFLSFWTDSVQRAEYQGADFVPVTFVDRLTDGQIGIIYTSLVAGLVLATLVRSATFFAGTLRASINIHERFFNSIIRAPMSFFDFSPIGILLNRLSRDIGFVDETLPATAIEIVTIFVNVTGIIVLAVLLNVINLFATIVLLVLVIYARTICASTITRLKQIEGVTKSPIFSHLSTTLSGLATIRAFKVQDEFVRIFNKHQDVHTSAWFNYISSGRWLAVALDWSCILFISIVITLLLALSLDATNASLVGLLISQVVVLPGPLQWGTRQLIEVESQMTSVQRVKEFSELKSEEETLAESDGAGAELDDVVAASYQSGRIAPAPPTPPTGDREGEIEFVNVSLSYFPDEPPVLRRLSFCIKPREKVAIVGRTGAGKSSIVSVLFRLYDFEGTIKVNGRDTKSMRLAELRRTMSIIPQDPILFGGTIRKNLDPFGDFADAQLWDALDAVHLGQLFARHPLGLDYTINEGGSNFSVGQRQLICLARAIARRNKILILDEATANVDPETDAFIQRTIARQFRQCTVLTIAHRLVTIVDSDRVLVLERGEISEFGPPRELLASGGLFKQMVDSSGQQAARLVRLIEEAHERRTAGGGSAPPAS
jgi:ABC-type multidrug transport system fused ATPase/permease subunit